MPWRPNDAWYSKIQNLWTAAAAPGTDLTDHDEEWIAEEIGVDGKADKDRLARRLLDMRSSATLAATYQHELMCRAWARAELEADGLCCTVSAILGVRRPVDISYSQGWVHGDWGPFWSSTAEQGRSAEIKLPGEPPPGASWDEPPNPPQGPEPWNGLLQCLEENCRHCARLLEMAGARAATVAAAIERAMAHARFAMTMRNSAGHRASHLAILGFFDLAADWWTMCGGGSLRPEAAGAFLDFVDSIARGAPPPREWFLRVFDCGDQPKLVGSFRVITDLEEPDAGIWLDVGSWGGGDMESGAREVHISPDRAVKWLNDRIARDRASALT